jgi:methyl-accepting chemotaxis protein
VRLPSFSIAAKLYAIFALLATATVALAVEAVLNARRHAVLNGEFEAAFAGAINVERVNALVCAAGVESRHRSATPRRRRATARTR